MLMVGVDAGRLIADLAAMFVRPTRSLSPVAVSPNVPARAMHSTQAWLWWRNVFPAAARLRDWR